MGRSDVVKCFKSSLDHRAYICISKYPIQCSSISINPVGSPCWAQEYSVSSPVFLSVWLALSGIRRPSGHSDHVFPESRYISTIPPPLSVPLFSTSTVPSPAINQLYIDTPHTVRFTGFTRQRPDAAPPPYPNARIKTSDPGPPLSEDSLHTGGQPIDTATPPTVSAGARGRFAAYRIRWHIHWFFCVWVLAVYEGSWVAV